MKIILSPAKKMKMDTDFSGVIGKPVFLDDTKIILSWLKGKNREELKKLWKCNDKLADENYERIAGMKLTGNLTPAILSYEGIAYQYMAPAVFDDEQLSYIQSNLRILSPVHLGVTFGC